MSENAEQNISIKEMANWLRMLGMKQLMTVLESDVNDEKKKQAYQYSDGEKTTRDIAELIGVGHSTVSSWWKKWITLGLGEYTIASGGHRFKKAFDLETLGITTNQRSKQKETQSNTTAKEEENA